MAIVDRVRDLVTPIVEAEGVALYDVEHQGGVLRVFVDAPDRVLGDETTGIEIGVIQRISRQVSHLLDEADPIPGRYTLEVSCPGLERPLRTPEHFRRAVVTEVKVKTHLQGILGTGEIGKLLVIPQEDLHAAVLLPALGEAEAAVAGLLRPFSVKRDVERPGGIEGSVVFLMVAAPRDSVADLLRVTLGEALRP